jgi:hypothetical protein
VTWVVVTSLACSLLLLFPSPYHTFLQNPFFIRSSYFKFLSKKLTSFDKERKKERKRSILPAAVFYIPAVTRNDRIKGIEKA